MDKRFNKITTLLGEYATGRFDKRLAVSARLDEIDAFSNGINILGDELKAITIARDYFTNIFNSVSDMVFIVNTKGMIEDVNRSAETQLRYESGTLVGQMLNQLHQGDPAYFKRIAARLKKNSSLILDDSLLHTSEGKMIPVRLHAVHFKFERKRQRLILLTASDISFQKQAENLVLRTIIDTQEKERQRLAKDLHDGLAQQLSAIKFYISATADLDSRRQQKAILLKAGKALTEVITDMRSICFNLMPKTLEEFGLVKAVRELCHHLPYKGRTSFQIEQQAELPALSAALKIDLYRIIQEFIANAIKHGETGKITISFSCRGQLLLLELTDDGKGFDLQQRNEGMGIRNLQSRVRSHSGQLRMVSQIGKGTCYTIAMPL